jgi:hypothetical protein
MPVSRDSHARLRALSNEVGFMTDNPFSGLLNGLPDAERRWAEMQQRLMVTEDQNRTLSELSQQNAAEIDALKRENERLYRDGQDRIARIVSERDHYKVKCSVLRAQLISLGKSVMEVVTTADESDEYIPDPTALKPREPEAEVQDNGEDMSTAGKTFGQPEYVEGDKL